MDGRRISDRIEETLIAALMAAMTLVTFANVVMRYVFNSNLLWALELTVFMFGWLVLLGASYAVKTRAHLGVDIVVDAVPPRVARILGLFSVGCCLAFSLLMLKGAYDYWAVFVGLPPTSGRWLPTGFEEKFRSQAFYEVQDVPMLAPLRFLEDLLNEGESYERIPKAVPYLVLPLSMLLLTLRFAQAGAAIWRGSEDRLVAGHDADSGAERLSGDGEGG